MFPTRTIALILLFALFVPLVSASELSAYKVLNTKTHQLHSEVLSENIAIFVGLPFNYDPLKSYPIVVVLDADVMFGLVTQYSQLTAFEPSSVSYITIGVGYGGFNKWLKGRNRDYHPAKENQSNKGAKSYLSFLEKELLPLVENKYKVDESRKILYGHSSAGLFSVYTALNKPALFSSIIASSPSLEWQERYFVENMKAVDPKRLPKLYISVSNLEEKTLNSIQAFKKKQQFEQNRFKYELFENQSHMGVIPSAYAAGINWILRHE